MTLKLKLLGLIPMSQLTSLSSVCQHSSSSVPGRPGGRREQPPGRTQGSPWSASWCLQEGRGGEGRGGELHNIVPNMLPNQFQLELLSPV